jgi:hypothetical protein
LEDYTIIPIFDHHNTEDYKVSSCIVSCAAIKNKINSLIAGKQNSKTANDCSFCDGRYGKKLVSS